ncbi:hypothetical protein [Chamaesiphon sp. OTE_75_metabat_556]|uniref:hypothetical protein n=1 Tax=Chamaesiphon sp. OTE_75_metabat_556 TaxID=2964692 RepID=UPI00286AE1EF|nr:hypothetical protein [Chamaesiphon sp. OTE_75_metabat_556]
MLVVSILGIGSICSTPAHAATFNYSGNTTGAPTFDRGGGSNSVFPYDVFSFNVDVGGSYSGSTELAMQVQLLKCHDNMLLI